MFSHFWRYSLKTCSHIPQSETNSPTSAWCTVDIKNQICFLHILFSFVERQFLLRNLLKYFDIFV